jgi:predicted transcriptional regulator
MPPEREKFATQVSPEVLQRLRELAKKEGRQFQAVVEEAFHDVIEKHDRAKPRPSVVAAHRASMDRYAAVYKKLAE